MEKVSSGNRLAFFYELMIWDWDCFFACIFAKAKIMTKTRTTNSSGISSEHESID